MLVLSRQKDQTIMIGDEIEITVVDIKGDKVRIGINAPKSVTVHRKEIYDAIKAENIAASRAAASDKLLRASSLLKPKPLTDGGPEKKDEQGK